MSSESSLKIRCCSLENNTDFKCSLVVQSMAKRVYDICNNLTAYRIEGELAALCIEFRAVVIQARMAIQLPTPSICNYSELVVLFSWLFGLLRKQCHCVLATQLSGGAVCIVAEQGSFKSLTHLVTGSSPCACCCPLCRLNKGCRYLFYLISRAAGAHGLF